MSAKQRRAAVKKHEDKVKAFNPKIPRAIGSSLKDYLPMELPAKIWTNGFYNSSATTNSIQSTVVTNSLLLSAHSFTSGGQSSFLDELALEYQKYRVMAYSLEVELIGRDDQRVSVSLAHQTNLPSYATGSAFDFSSAAVPRSQYLIVGTNTDSPNVVNFKKVMYRIEDMVGTTAFLAEENYAGTINSSGVFTSPSSPTYSVLHYGQIDGTAFGANSCPLIRVRMCQWVNFYSRRS